ncbi:trace amine-associated receptor 13c-like [Epinephelus moara]|uniref:trace amine-associated receptor 13c-like n=1 Tax=Epinephelus moara TaxID=300413 RepID=UPI00214E648E|nr:trace amine-associated receptor 13c-like [Epinephelus moara]
MTPVPRESCVEPSDESRIGEEKETHNDVELCFPQLLNASCTRPKRPHSEVILTELVLSCITLLTATLNMMVIISISLLKQLHTPTNLLLLSLAVSDFFVGFLIALQITYIDGCWPSNDFMCSLFYVIECSITSASVGNMVLISLDRYVAICDPMHYSTKVTPKRVKVCVCLCWTSSIIFQTLLLRDNLEQPGKHVSCHGECVVVSNSIAAAADVIFTFICPITVIVVLYVRVFAVAVSQARAMRAHIVTLQGSVKVTAKKSEIKAARTLGVVVVVFLICICPYYCVFLSSNVHNALSVAFVVCLFYFNSCLNPVIYAFFYPWFRKCLRLIFTLEILKPGSREANIL